MKAVTDEFISPQSTIMLARLCSTVMSTDRPKMMQVIMIPVSMLDIVSLSFSRSHFIRDSKDFKIFNAYLPGVLNGPCIEKLPLVDL
jgi:hypothetical protein